jgi:hypothetical protein
MKSRATYSAIEQEIVVLRAAWDMIDGMVNLEMFVRHPEPSGSHVMFNTMTHRRMFNVLLGDFLSQPVDGAFDLRAAHTKDKSHRNTYLAYLVDVCDEPRLNNESAALRGPVQAFAEWLDSDCVYPNLWLSSISEKLDLRVKRIVFLKICGDIAKHNFSRLRHNVKQIMAILDANSLVVDEAKAFLVLPDFYEKFHDNVFAYHASTIAEMLNNIRWGIFHYLEPEYARSYERLPHDDMAYKFNYPAGCSSTLGRAIYWDLMNQVRGRPRFPVFVTTDSLKKRF